MNKAQLVEAVAKTLDIPVARAKEPVEAVLDAIIRQLADGGQVSVTGFGVFDTAVTAAHKARNPQGGPMVDVPERTRVRFRPGQALKDLVNGKTLPVGSAARKAPKGSLTGGAR